MRAFGKNTSNTMDVGNGATNPVLSGAAAVSFSAWIVVDSTTTGSANYNNIFEFELDGGKEGFAANIDQHTTPGTNKLRVRGRSQGADGLKVFTSTAALTVGELTHVAGCINFTSDLIFTWVNATELSGAATFGAATYTTGTPTETDRIGQQTGTLFSSTAFAGAIAELAVWKRALLLDEVTSLSLGMSPWLIDKPALYWPLYGFESPEADLAAGLLGTITGSVPKRTEMPPVLPIESQVAQGGFPFASSVFNVAPLASNLMRRKAA